MENHRENSWMVAQKDMQDVGVTEEGQDEMEAVDPVQQPLKGRA